MEQSELALAERQYGAAGLSRGITAGDKGEQCCYVARRIPFGFRHCTIRQNVGRRISPETTPCPRRRSNEKRRSRRAVKPGNYAPQGEGSSPERKESETARRPARDDWGRLLLVRILPSARSSRESHLRTFTRTSE